MAIDNKITDENLQYHINREATKISALSSGKIDKYEFLTGEEILPSDQSRVREQAKFPFSPLGKSFEKQIKTIEDEGIKLFKIFKTRIKPRAGINWRTFFQKIWEIFKLRRK